MNDRQTPRVLVLGAHPDDAEYHAGGFATLMRAAGHEVKFVSVTDGGAGHHTRSPEELRAVRRAEAAAAGKVLGIAYEVWSNPDGALLPTLEVRAQIIRELRTFDPDLVLTHRTCDYHPDHRAVSQAVQDACYMVTVPLVVPEVAALRRDPIVAYMTDTFTRPNPMRPDVLIDVGPLADSIVSMLACHASQVFEWLPYNERIMHTVPTECGPAGDAARRAWLHGWFVQRTGPRSAHFRDAIQARFGTPRGDAIHLVEALEISEYAAPLDDNSRARLFPFLSDQRESGKRKTESGGSPA